MYLGEGIKIHRKYFFSFLFSSFFFRENNLRCSYLSFYKYSFSFLLPSNENCYENCFILLLFFLFPSHPWPVDFFFLNILKVQSSFMTKEKYWEKKWHGILRRTELLFYLDLTSAYRPPRKFITFNFSSSSSFLSFFFILEPRLKGLIFSSDFHPGRR